jgi:hypothetical protein
MQADKWMDALQTLWAALPRAWQWATTSLAALPHVRLWSFTEEQKVTDAGNWLPLSGYGPQDRPWADVLMDLTDALDAWRQNFLIRQIVRLTTAYVVGDGLKVSATHPWAKEFVEDFWADKQNRMAQRLPAWCDELTRAGELFVALFPNRVTGMQYVRAIPARQITSVETDPEDYEKETGYVELPVVTGQLAAVALQPKHWNSLLTAGPDEPVLLHFTINKPVGATRGEGDLTPLLPWARRYVEWLKERVRANKVRNDLACAEVIIEDDSQVDKKRQQYATNPPTGGGIFVHGRGEELKFPAASIGAYEAKDDGLALRLAMAAGANVPLHFLGEGQSATRSTAEAMGDPTLRHYRMRQVCLVEIVTGLVEAAYARRCAMLGLGRQPVDLGLVVECPDVSREDNQALAAAAGAIVNAFAIMRANGWITDELAVRLAFKFAGEVLSEEQIQEVLDHGRDDSKRGVPPSPQPPPSEGEGAGGPGEDADPPDGRASE